MQIEQLDRDRFLINDGKVEYELELFQRYDLEIDVTRKDGKKVTQEERDKVIQCYYEL